MNDADDGQIMSDQVHNLLENLVADLNFERDPMNAPCMAIDKEKVPEVFPVFTVGRA